MHLPAFLAIELFHSRMLKWNFFKQVFAFGEIWDSAFIQSERGFPDSSAGKNPPAMWETWVRPLGWEDPLEKGKASTKQHIVAYELASQEEYNAFPGSLMNGTASIQDAEMQNFLNTS